MDDFLQNTGVPQPLLDAICSVREEFPEIKAVYLFGSRIRGGFHAKSDLDVALVIFPDEDLDFEDEFKFIAKNWKREIRQQSKCWIKIHIVPLIDPTGRKNFDDTTGQYVQDCSLCVYDFR
jgi:hypothetical protein